MGAVIDVVLLNGTVGAGKTTVAEEISRQEGDEGGVHALIDVDAVRRLRPSPPGDPFQFELELANLGDLARNYRAAGATRIVLAGVVEQRADRARLEEAIGSDAMLVVRLTARADVVAARIRARHDRADDREWHLARAPELAAILDVADADDLVLDTSETTPAAVAHQVRAAAGWGRD